MPATADEIPPEIWDLIASFLPRSKRHRLISLNRYFLSKVLHERYGEIRWTILNETMILRLRRLQDPFIAQYVRKLHVQLWFINHVVRSKILRRNLGKSFGSSIFRRLHNYFEHVESMSYLPLFAKGNNPSKYTTTQVLSLMRKALGQMSNLTCYSFEWGDLPINKDSQLFLKTVQESARGLRKLVLHAQIANYEYLLKYAKFDGLEEIWFHFDYETASKDDDSQDPSQTNSDALKTNIAPFINRFAPSLHHLSISSDSKASITPLFESLVAFPNLRALELNMPFNSQSLPSPKPLLDFLTTHSSTLLYVKLKPPFQSVAQYQGGREAQAAVTKSGTWSTMNDLLRSTPPTALSNLEALDIPAMGSIETTLALLNRSADTLTRLTLSGRYFTQNELRTIYNTFTHRPLYARLVNLHIDVSEVNISMLYDIATRFPRMESLVLVTCTMSKVWGWNYSESLDPSTFHYDGHTSHTQASIISTHMLQAFQDWSLCDFSIYVGRYREHQTGSSIYAGYEHHAMLEVSNFVGSIRRFKGREIGNGPEVVDEVYDSWL